MSKLKEAVDSKTFERAVNEKVLKSMAHPGEGVGLVLAQVGGAYTLLKYFIVI